MVALRGASRPSELLLAPAHRRQIYHSLTPGNRERGGVRTHDQRFHQASALPLSYASVRGFHGARTRRPEVIILGAAPGSSESMGSHRVREDGFEPPTSAVLGTDALPLSYSRKAFGPSFTAVSRLETERSDLELRRHGGSPRPRTWTTTDRSQSLCALHQRSKRRGLSFRRSTEETSTMGLPFRAITRKRSPLR